MGSKTSDYALACWEYVLNYYQQCKILVHFCGTEKSQNAVDGFDLFAEKR